MNTTSAVSRPIVAWRFAILLLCLPLSALAVQRDELVGYWYGEGNYDATVSTKWLTVREPSGALSVKVRYYKDGGFLSEAMSIGSWKLEGGLYIATYTATNARIESSPQVHRYELLKLEGAVLEYRSIQPDRFQNTVYRVKRVQRDFSLP